MNNQKTNATWISLGLLLGLVIGGAPTMLLLLLSLFLMVFSGVYLLPIIVSIGLDTVLATHHSVQLVFGIPFTAMMLILLALSIPLRGLLKF